MATERRAETATDEEERTVMERLVLKAWKGLEVHAKMGQRGASSPMNNSPPALRLAHAHAARGGTILR